MTCVHEEALVSTNLVRLRYGPTNSYHVGMNEDVVAFNAKQTGANRAICELLAGEIARGLPKAENKIWHGAPVWFLDGNPVAGYDVLKNCVRLLFWSGQSFDEPTLQVNGSFKAAEARYTEPGQVNTTDLRRWLQKSIDIQWDYKNIVKRRGVLEKLKG
jgi:hypothetical protein